MIHPLFLLSKRARRGAGLFFLWRIRGENGEDSRGPVPRYFGFGNSFETLSLWLW